MKGWIFNPGAHGSPGVIFVTPGGIQLPQGGPRGIYFNKWHACPGSYQECFDMLRLFCFVLGRWTGEVSRRWKGRLVGKVGREGWQRRLEGKVRREGWKGRVARLIHQVVEIVICLNCWLVVVVTSK